MKQAASLPPIELKLAELGQLFNSMDPAPFRERDLDTDAEEFIVGWAREVPRKAAIRLVIHLSRSPETGAEDARATVREALKNYFGYRAEVTGLELRQLVRLGRLSLAIGLAFLATCHATATLFTPGPGTWHGIAREGLAILGWVAMWHPLEILLYRWWPVLQTKKLYLRLAEAEIEVKAGG